MGSLDKGSLDKAIDTLNVTNIDVDDIDFPANKYLTFNGDGGLKLYHNDSHGYIDNSNGNIYIRPLSQNFVIDVAEDIVIRDYLDGYSYMFFIDSGNSQIAIGNNSRAFILNQYGDVYLKGVGDGDNEYLHIQTPDTNYGHTTAFVNVVTNLRREFQHQYFYDQTENGVIYWYSTSAYNAFMLKPANSYALWNPRDNAGFYTGISGDIAILHDGTDSWIKNGTGHLIIQNIGLNHTILRETASVKIQDYDDSNIDLFDLDTGARTLKIGNSGGADDITITHYGNTVRNGNLTVQNGVFESEFSTVKINDQNETNTDNSADIDLTEFTYYKAGNGWVSTGNTPHNSLTNAVLDYTSMSAMEKALLSLSKIQINIDNVGVTISSSGASFTIKWYYSTDGGSNWILVGTQTSVSVNSTNIPFQNGGKSVIVDGKDISDNITVRVTAVANASDASTIDLDSIEAWYYVGLKV